MHPTSPGKTVAAGLEGVSRRPGKFVGRTGHAVEILKRRGRQDSHVFCEIRGPTSIRGQRAEVLGRRRDSSRAAGSGPSRRQGRPPP